jgi:peptide deformylase
LTRYTTIELVKKELRIDASDLTADEEIDQDISTASSMVDAMATAAGVTIASPTPAIIEQIARFFAAWLFRKREAGETNSQHFYESGVALFTAMGTATSTGEAEFVQGEADAD